MLFKAKVNEEFDFIIEKIKQQFVVNGQEEDYDIQQIDSTTFHIIYKQKSYKVDILSADESGRGLRIKVNKHVYDVTVKDEQDVLLEELGIADEDEQSASELRAPMPGLIIDVLVTPGQQVVKGDALIVLKAMKMENVLKSPKEGMIQAINVDVGEKIEKDTLLIQF